MDCTTLFTIGHSTHAIEGFTGLLKTHGITALYDVRSTPYSRRNPQFNREELQASLEKEGIAYLFLGRELGARSEDPACYENQQVQYRLLAETDLFKSGICKIREGMGAHRIALMCAEKEPLHCHRTILVARELAKQGIPIQHIHADGAIESHEELTIRLMKELHLPEADMFHSAEDLAAEAYALQGKAMGYRRKA